MTEVYCRITSDADTHERLQEIAAEGWAWELVEALKSAVAGAPHWRSEAQALLRRIDAGELPEPRPGRSPVLHFHHTDIDEDIT
jgi:hypothetical protein